MKAEDVMSIDPVTVRSLRFNSNRSVSNTRLETRGRNKLIKYHTHR